MRGAGGKSEQKTVAVVPKRVYFNVKKKVQPQLKKLCAVNYFTEKDCQWSQSNRRERTVDGIPLQCSTEHSARGDVTSKNDGNFSCTFYHDRFLLVNC